MALAASSPVGHYRILRALGQGGMGEVYVAVDERLGREVALKMMHPALARGAERLKRFETEARAASAINHPNILSVFDVGTLDGAPYIVTELLDGDVLRDLLSGPLGVRKSLDLARQMALGLAAAHDRGIVHRDIKPENLFVTRDGHLKILDFGVAKLLDLGGDNVTDERPTTPALTTPDAVLGTPGYMAPEQVRGDPIDPRADLFALGAVLYEMLAGKRAFAGKAPHAVMYAVLHGDPPLIADAGVTVSPVVEAVVRRCLEKRRDERFASARDLAFQLEALASGATLSTAAAVAIAPPRRRDRRPLVAAGIAGVAAIAAVAWWQTRSSVKPAAPPVAVPVVTTGSVPELLPLTFRSGRITSARLARDGSHFYVGASWNGEPQQVYAATVNRPEVTSLGVEGDVLAVTHDGDLLVALGGWLTMETTRTMVRIPPSGGTRSVIAEQVIHADVGPDDQIAVIRRDSGHCRVEYPVGTVIDEIEGWFSHVRVSPDGTRLAYIVHPMHEDDRGWPVIVTLSDGVKQPLSGEWQGAQGVTWDAAGRGIYFSGAGGSAIRELWYGGDGGEVRLIAAVPANIDTYDILPGGDLLAVTWQWDTQARMKVPGGEPVEVSWFDTTNPIDLSSDGRTLLFLESGLAAQRDTYRGYVRHPDGSVTALGAGQPLELSADGTRVLLLEPRTLRVSIVSTGAVAPRPLVTGELAVQAAWWFPDDQTILLDASAADGHERLWRYRDGAAPEPVTAPGQSARRFERPISGDGALLCYTDLDGHRGVVELATGKALPTPALADGERFLGWYRGTHDWIIANDHGANDLTRLGLDGKRTPLGSIPLPAPGSQIAMWWMQVTDDALGWAHAYFRVDSRVYQVRLKSTLTAPPRSSP